MKDNNNNQISIYVTKDKKVNVSVLSTNNDVWLNQQELSMLFGRDRTNIGRHIKNALKEELFQIPVSAFFAHTASDGKKYNVEHYNLDMILSIGYRVKSSEGIHFRKWANTVLKDHMLLGYTVNQSRLENIGKVIDIFEHSLVPEISGISSLLKEYIKGLDKLDDYDHQVILRLSGSKDTVVLDYSKVRDLISSMSYGEESTLFGK